MQERFSEQKNLLEFLNILNTRVEQVKTTAMTMPEAKENLPEKMAGKRVVLFYMGQSALRILSEYGAQALQDWLDYVRESLGQVREIFLLWYDDGLIDNLSKETGQNETSDSPLDVTELSKIYEQEKQKFNECLWTGYSSSIPAETLAELVDAFYGDIGTLSEAIASRGRLALQADWLSLCDNPQMQTLANWLAQFLRTYCHDVTVEWREKVRGKRVVLYCLKAEMLLHYGMAAVGKLEQIVSCMSGQSELVLWWSEDPRIVDLLPSLTEEIRIRYLNVCEKVQRGAGIFDQSGDIRKALDYADIYYGDWIDDLQFLHRRGKPSLLQNITGTITADGKAMQLLPFWCTAVCHVGDDLWLTHGKLALLCRYSLKSKLIELVERIPGKTFFQESLYKEIYHYNDKLFLLPSWAECRIVIYYIKESRFDCLQIPDDGKSKGGFFRNMYAYGKYLYAMPAFYRYVIRIDMDTLEIKLVGDCLGQAAKIAPQAKYMNDVVKVNERTVAGVFTYTNLVMLYDFDKEEIRMLRVGKNNASYSSLTCLGDDLFLCDSKNKRLVKYSMSMNKIVGNYRPPLDVYIMHKLPDGAIMLDSVYNGDFCVINGNGEVLIMQERQVWSEKNPLCYNYTCGMSYADGDDVWYFDRCDYRAYRYRKNGILDAFDFPSLDINESFYSNQVVDMKSEKNNLELPGGNLLLEIKALISKREAATPAIGETIYRDL